MENNASCLNYISEASHGSNSYFVLLQVHKNEGGRLISPREARKKRRGSGFRYSSKKDLERSKLKRSAKTRACIRYKGFILSQSTIKWWRFRIRWSILP
jgi:hypothetical protein